jgi:hypothetical protein
MRTNKKKWKTQTKINSNQQSIGGVTRTTGQRPPYQRRNEISVWKSPTKPGLPDWAADGWWDSSTIIPAVPCVSIEKLLAFQPLWLYTMCVSVWGICIYLSCVCIVYRLKAARLLALESIHLAQHFELSKGDETLRFLYNDSRQHLSNEISM